MSDELDGNGLGIFSDEESEENTDSETTQDHPPDLERPNAPSLPRVGRRPKLQDIMDHMPQVYQQLLVLIRAGAYYHIAAASLGIHPDTFIKWLTIGRKKKGGVYRQLFDDVMQAIATARLTRELTVAKDDPKFWLRNGPGKNSGAFADLPGWTDDTLNVNSSIDHAIHGKIEVEHTDNTPQFGERLVAEALGELQQLGLINLTPAGMKSLSPPQADSITVEHNEPEQSHDAVSSDPRSEDEDASQT